MSGLDIRSFPISGIRLDIRNVKFDLLAGGLENQKWPLVPVIEDVEDSKGFYEISIPNVQTQFFVDKRGEGD